MVCLLVACIGILIAIVIYALYLVPPSVISAHMGKLRSNVTKKLQTLYLQTFLETIKECVPCTDAYASTLPG